MTRDPSPCSSSPIPISWNQCNKMELFALDTYLIGIAQVGSELEIGIGFCAIRLLGDEKSIRKSIDATSACLITIPSNHLHSAANQSVDQIRKFE